MEQIARQYGESGQELISPMRAVELALDEYERKAAALPAQFEEYKQAGLDIQTAASISGTYGREHFDLGHLQYRTLESNLLKSAWLYLFTELKINEVASAQDKKLFEQGLERPAPFNYENIKASYGPYINDRRGNILRGLAEVFSNLDPAFKSHEKMKIGVKGLPKRVIIGQLNSFYGYGKDQLRDILNALAVLQGKPLVSHEELSQLERNEEALMQTCVIEVPQRYGDPERVQVYARGVRLRRFSNGNGHLFFEPDTLLDVNRALADFYGDVLPDCSEGKPAQQRPGTAVSKDLQYYPTPAAAVERLIGEACIRPGDKVLEPSCGCGRLLDGIRKAGGESYGIEVDASRAMQARAKGYSVLVANFLETVPTPTYDRVVMNPPFYGKHYAKHVEHALKFLKPGGLLVSILPITARHDHGLLTGSWRDLPVGSFRESGTNINTTILTIRKRD